MSSVLAPNSGKNLAMPRGRISFAKFDSSGNTFGEVDLGNCLALDITPKYTYKDHLTSRGPFNVLDASLISQMEVDLKFTPEERSRENMALFFLGDPDTQKAAGAGKVYQGAGVVTGAALVPYLDRWIDLGKRYIKAGTIVVSHSASPVLDDTVGFAVADARVDYENGLLMIKSTNTKSITEAEAAVTVTFHYGKATMPLFTQGTDPVIGFMRYAGLSAVGPRHSVKLWKVQINPDSAIKMIDPGNIAGLSFSGKVYIDDDTLSHSTLPFGEVLELQDSILYPS